MPIIDSQTQLVPQDRGCLRGRPQAGLFPVSGPQWACASLRLPGYLSAMPVSKASPQEPLLSSSAVSPREGALTHNQVALIKPRQPYLADCSGPQARQSLQNQSKRAQCLEPWVKGSFEAEGMGYPNVIPKQTPFIPMQTCSG